MAADTINSYKFMHGLHTCEHVFFGLSQHADPTSDGFVHDSYETIEKMNTIKTMQSEH